jgi:hypothetical protein
LIALLKKGFILASKTDAKLEFVIFYVTKQKKSFFLIGTELPFAQD